MLRQKITDQLLAWKNTPGRKPLIIKGCRQCGKTFSVLEFARKNYKHTVYLNFFENPDYASVFSGSLEIDNIVMMLSALLGKDAVFEPGQTILILDEIQDCPEARTALKFFRIDGRYDVIGTGSLLGVKGYGARNRDPFLSDRRRFLKCTHWILKNSYGPMTSPNLSLRCCKGLWTPVPLCRKRCTTGCGSFCSNIPLWEECRMLSRPL